MIAPRDLPAHAPVARGGISSAFAERALGKREAKRLTELMADAERRARACIEAATRETEEIFASARAEAEAILARLPDFAAIEAARAAKGKSALRAIRDVADRHGLPLAVVVGRVAYDRAKAARAEAVRAVAEACPQMTDGEIAALFSGVAAGTVLRLRKGGAA